MADEIKAVANDPAAPPDERYDAQAEMQRIYRPLASELLPSDAVREVIDFINDGYQQAEMAKAQVIQFPGRFKPVPKSGPISVFLDELQIFAHGEYYEKPAPLGFDMLRRMVEDTPLLNSIVLTRIRQVMRFCARSEDGGLGFEVRHVDRKHTMSSEEEKASLELTRFIANCGWEFNPRERKRLKRDTFPQLMGKMTRDTLAMDACPFETEMKRDRKMGIDGLYAVDGSTIRLCTESGYEGNDEIFAVQVVSGRMVAAYDLDRLVYEVRNPRTDVRLTGYGLGETELLVRVVTGFLNAMSYNIAGFDKNALPKGLLHLSGDYSKEDLTSFKRQWNATVRGVNNAWALPVMVSKDQESKASFERFGIEFDEMHFSKWMTFLASIACAIYGMAPDEINFESFAASKSSLSGSDTTEKLADSKDKGLRPLMSFFEQTISDYVITTFDERFCFRWVGMDPADETREWEAKKLILSVDELRAEKGYRKWIEENPDGFDLGGAPLNPGLMGPWMQAQQGPEPGPDFGDPNGAGGGADEDPNATDSVGNAAGAPGDPQAGGQPGAPAPPAEAPAPGGGQFGGKGEGDFGKGFGTVYSL